MSKIRQSARGEECTLRLPYVCNFNPETTVWCHSNRLEDGKGMGLKARDEEGCYGCSDCHDVLDGRKPRPDWMSYELLQRLFDEARDQSRRILRRKGLIK